MHMLLLMITPDSPRLNSSRKNLKYLKSSKSYVTRFKERRTVELLESEVIMGKNSRTANLKNYVQPKESSMSSLPPSLLNRMV